MTKWRESVPPHGSPQHTRTISPAVVADCKRGAPLPAFSAVVSQQSKRRQKFRTVLGLCLRHRQCTFPERQRCCFCKWQYCREHRARYKLQWPAFLGGAAALSEKVLLTTVFPGLFSRPISPHISKCQPLWTVYVFCLASGRDAQPCWWLSLWEQTNKKKQSCVSLSLSRTRVCKYFFGVCAQKGQCLIPRPSRCNVF